MKKNKCILLLLIVFAYTYMVQAADVEKCVKSEVTSVTVYMSGAEIHHNAKVKLSKGKNTITFTSLSPKLDSKSISVDVLPKDITILSVNSKTNYLVKKVDNPNIKMLRDSSESITDQLTMIANERETLQKEKDLLFKNEAIGGTQKGILVEEIEAAADFFRDRNNEINKLVFQLQKKEKKLTAELGNINKQLSELNAVFNPPSSEITVVVISNKEEQAVFEFKYIVDGAGWAPKYDIRTEGIDKPITLVYRAVLFNNCGLDWKDVKLKLSTADPKQGAEKPTLDSWTLSNENNIRNSNYEEDIAVNGLRNNPYQKGKPFNATDTSKVKFQKIEVSELSAEFDIPTPYTIISDSKPYTVDVTSYEIPAKYEHFAIPKMDDDAFLVAKITGWNERNLISGQANIYFNGTYLGQSFVNTNDIEDTLMVSLGRDKKVAVNRVKRVNSYERHIVGNSVKETFLYETTIKNNRESVVNIEVQDQIPVSQDNSIDVTVVEITAGNLDKLSGKLNWKLKLAPGETQKIILSYSVKYPKNYKQPAKKKYRTISAPSF